MENSILPIIAPEPCMDIGFFEKCGEPSDLAGGHLEDQPLPTA